MTTKVVCVAPAKIRAKEEPVAPTSNTSLGSPLPDADQIRRKWLKEMTSVIAAPSLQSTTA